MTFWYNENERLRISRVFSVISIISILTIGISLTLFSFKSVNYNQYGLRQNQISKEIENKVYKEGLYFVGFWNEFILFPSTYITVEFTPSYKADDIPISVQTKNGLLVSIDLSFQFRIRRTELIFLYSNYGYGYKDYIQSVARSSLREVIGSHNAEILYSNRSLINNEMSNALFNSINSIVEVGQFQLRAINFPDSFEKAVEQYEVWRIEVEIAQLEQQAQIIKQETLTLIETFTANRTLIEYDALIQALENMKESLNMTTEQMLTYLWIQTIKEHDQAYLFIGLQDIPLLIPLNNTV